MQDTNPGPLSPGLTNEPPHPNILYYPNRTSLHKNIFNTIKFEIILVLFLRILDFLIKSLVINLLY